MARDPPSLLDSSELRDVSLQPSAVRNARVTIIHPQLRDLILPLEKGRILYPRGNGIEEVRWVDEREGCGEGNEERVDEEGVHVGGITGSAKPFVKLGFIPNCLTASRGILAAGGQHGELYLSHLPSPLSRSSNRYGAPKGRETCGGPFNLSMTLPTRSINNSIVILPSWPSEWSAIADKRCPGYGGVHHGSDGLLCGDGGGGEDDEAIMEDEEGGSEVDDGDEAMDMDDEDDERDFDEPLSPATYPNTVPFFHAPRIPNLPTQTGSSSSFDYPSATRRTSSFSHQRSAPRSMVQSHSQVARQSFSVNSPPGQPPVQIVTSLPGSSRSASMSSIRPSRPASRLSTASQSGWTKFQSEPRILVSNNDQTVKMFSLRSPPVASSSSAATSRPRTSYERTFLDSRLDDRASSRQSQSIFPERRLSRTAASSADNRRPSLAASSFSTAPPPTHFGSSFGWDSVGLNEGILAAHQAERERLQDAERTRFESVIGMSVSSHRSSRLATSAPPPTSALGGSVQLSIRAAAAATDKSNAERKLSKVGGTRFKYAINHSSLSPDLKTMVSVGDSTDVYLFQVIDGGREFRKISTYSAATDSGFSTAWSKDGRKFAVASQDGQVTVWDHRSSKFLATFFSSNPASRTLASSPSSPSFATDIHAAQRPLSPDSVPSSLGWEGDDEAVMLVDPISGELRPAGSISGREAARVVKFSPEGSDRDLMVFTEENTNIHIIDAKTFNTHVIVPVPPVADTPGCTPPGYIHRTGVEGGTWGIAGIAFDPTGNWLYSGTERSVVEWDMRRWGGGGEGGTWEMA